MRFPVGHLVRVEFSKWGGHRHWAYDGVYLGVDEHGEWLGVPRGTWVSRPDERFRGDHISIRVVHADGRPALSSFYRDAWNRVEAYVDIATPPTWDDTTLRMVDLDVIRRTDGTVFIDDEDEFADHRVSLGYPADVVTMARRSADRVLAEVRTAVPPYDGTADRWFEALGSLAST